MQTNNMKVNVTYINKYNQINIKANSNNIKTSSKLKIVSKFQYHILPCNKSITVNSDLPFYTCVSVTQKISQKKQRKPTKLYVTFEISPSLKIIQQQ